MAKEGLCCMLLAIIFIRESRLKGTLDFTCRRLRHYLSDVDFISYKKSAEIMISLLIGVCRVKPWISDAGN
jgi:hypothetical protein